MRSWLPSWRTAGAGKVREYRWVWLLVPARSPSDGGVSCGAVCGVVALTSAAPVTPQVHIALRTELTVSVKHLLVLVNDGLVLLKREPLSAEDKAFVSASF